MIAGIFLTVFLILLYPDPGMTPEEENNSVRLTFISPFANTGYWGTAATGILDTAEKYGMNVKCIGFAESDPQKQIRYIKSAIYSHADGIITAGIENSDEFKEVLDMASEAGIPVILIDWQIQQGINALVICGTTGESSTLTDAEHRRAIAFACERVNGRVPVIAGTGSNETDYAVELTKSACADGADAVLVVTPYYNKTTQRGLVTMYNTIADASTKPVILYNVPSRTGIGIEPATYVKLAEHPNIAAIKEANSDISKIVETFSLVGDRLDIYSGNDDQIVPILSMGGAGCISVLSNVIPAETVAITQRFFAGDVAGAAQLQCRYMPLIRALFCESNPIPVKAAMAALGYCDNYLRLPLVPMEEDHYQGMLQRMRELGLPV